MKMRVFGAARNVRFRFGKKAAADKLVEHRRLRLGVYPTRRRGVQSADNAVEFRNDAFPDIKRMYRVADERKSDRSKSVRT